MSRRRVLEGLVEAIYELKLNIQLGVYMDEELTAAEARLEELERKLFILETGWEDCGE